MSSRPFYGEFALAYDLLIDRPVRKEGATIATWLSVRGVLPGATILDAGCGTGRYSIELGRRGYAVQGIDLSDDSLAVARRALNDDSRNVSFATRSILNLHALERDGEERSSSYVFVMQCWTHEELESWLPQAGFSNIFLFRCLRRRYFRRCHGPVSRRRPVMKAVSFVSFMLEFVTC
jgi:SAM-dependent methyltransferase